MGSESGKDVNDANYCSISDIDSHDLLMNLSKLLKDFYKRKKALEVFETLTKNSTLRNSD